MNTFETTPYDLEDRPHDNADLPFEDEFQSWATFQMQPAQPDMAQLRAAALDIMSQSAVDKRAAERFNLLDTPDVPEMGLGSDSAGDTAIGLGDLVRLCTGVEAIVCSLSTCDCQRFEVTWFDRHFWRVRRRWAGNVVLLMKAAAWQMGLSAQAAAVGIVNGVE